MPKDKRRSHVRALPGPINSPIRIYKQYRGTWRWDCHTCYRDDWETGKTYYVGGTNRNDMQWVTERMVIDGLEWHRRYYQLVESGFHRALRGAANHIKKYHTPPYPKP